MIIRMLAMLGFLIFSGFAVAAEPQVRMEGEYIVIEAEQCSLTALFERVGQATGATVQVSPKVERPVSVSVPGRTLQQAMDALARQYALNIVLGWQRLADGSDSLASIDVLPDGNMDPKALAREDSVRQRALQQQNQDRPWRTTPGTGGGKEWIENYSPSGAVDQPEQSGQ